MSVLEVENLEVAIGAATILRGVSLRLEAGKTLGVVGESGCGKSMTGFSIMGMLPPTGRVVSGSIRLDGRELTELRKRDWPEIRGSQIALVMQDPFTSLNPMMRVGAQIAEAIRLHRKTSRDAAWRQAIDLLEKVGVPSPETSARKYPHQMSGGQRQRVVLAIAFACKPKVLIADEPTTALDVTLQAQILRLMRKLQEEEGVALMLISHDIGVIGALAHDISVFYAGRVVENGASESVLREPAHPYTKALLGSLPRAGQTELETIQGQPPDLANREPGCPFSSRCRHRQDACDEEPAAQFVAPDHWSACWFAEAVQTNQAPIGG